MRVCGNGVYMGGLAMADTAAAVNNARAQVDSRDPQRPGQASRNVISRASIN